MPNSPELQRGWTWPVPRWTEPAIAALGASRKLNDLGLWLANTFYRVIKAGTAKDLLAGTWMAHPLHPLLTDVTIGAWTGATVLDLVGGEGGRPGADRLAAVGILSALPTAATGLSELTDVVDKEERAVGTAHAVANVGAMGLWGLSWVARKAGARRTGLALSLAGTAGVTAAGFLGGHLSYRMGVGVDQTVFEPRLRTWTDVMADEELTEGPPKRVMVRGTNVLLYRTPSRIYALANRCSHRGGPLHKGRVEAGTVRCPWHLSIFRLDDGSIVQGPATAPQRAYEVRVRDGRIEIRERPQASTAA